MQVRHSCHLVKQWLNFDNPRPHACRYINQGVGCSALGRTPCTWVCILHLSAGVPPTCTGAYALHNGLLPSCTAIRFVPSCTRAYPPPPALRSTPLLHCDAIYLRLHFDTFFFFLPECSGYAPMHFLFYFWCVFSPQRAGGYASVHFFVFFLCVCVFFCC